MLLSNWYSFPTESFIIKSLTARRKLSGLSVTDISLCLTPSTTVSHTPRLYHFCDIISKLLTHSYLCTLCIIYYLLTAIGRMPGGSVTKIGRTYKKLTYISRTQNLHLTKRQHLSQNFTVLKTVFMLAHTKLADFSAVTLLSLLFCNWLHTRDITTAPTTENIFPSIVDTCVLSHCIATVATLPLLLYWVVT
jgi:hypothetical protein